ncbi:MAG: hypothetical protein PHX30_06110 [Candidatus Pacebacteria bacterium]|nr:hypothetical protein [Candidatus Paceibacterota bacterium]
MTETGYWKIIGWTPVILGVLSLFCLSTIDFPAQLHNTVARYIILGCIGGFAILLITDNSRDTEY